MGYNYIIILLIKGCLIWLQKLKAFTYVRNVDTNPRNGTENARPAVNGTQ